MRPALAFARAFLRALFCGHTSYRVEIMAHIDEQGYFKLVPVMTCCQCGQRWV